MYEEKYNITCSIFTETNEYLSKEEIKIKDILESLIFADQIDQMVLKKIHEILLLHDKIIYYIPIDPFTERILNLCVSSDEEISLGALRILMILIRYDDGIATETRNTGVKYILNNIKNRSNMVYAVTALLVDLKLSEQYIIDMVIKLDPGIKWEENVELMCCIGLKIEDKNLLMLFSDIIRSMNYAMSYNNKVAIINLIPKLITQEIMDEETCNEVILEFLNTYNTMSLFKIYNFIVSNKLRVRIRYSHIEDVMYLKNEELMTLCLHAFSKNMSQEEYTELIRLFPYSSKNATYNMKKIFAKVFCRHHKSILLYPGNFHIMDPVLDIVNEFEPHNILFLECIIHSLDSSRRVDGIISYLKQRLSCDKIYCIERENPDLKEYTSELRRVLYS